MNYYKISNDLIFDAREKIKDRYGNNIFEYIDQYPSFACPQTMMRYLKIYDLFKKAIEIPGDFFEFGTWKGSTALFLAKLLDEIEPQSKRKIFVFDNFSGLPAPSSEDSEFANSQIGEYKGDKDSMEFLIKSFDLNHRIELIEGDALITIPEFFNKNIPYIVSLAYFDFDLYEPTMVAWNHIKNYLIKGSSLVFDEGLDREHWLGEIKVVSQIINDKEFKERLSVQPNKLSRMPEVIINVL